MKRRETRFIRVIPDWTSVLIKRELTRSKGGEQAVHLELEFIVAPDKRVYRRALGWEVPHLVIDANILPPEHHIRLCRVRDKVLRKTVLREWRKRNRLQRNV